MQFSVLEQRLTSRAFALALDPVFDMEAVSKELVDIAAGNRGALERVHGRIHAAAHPRGRVTARILGALQAALSSPEPSGRTSARTPAAPSGVQPI